MIVAQLTGSGFDILNVAETETSLIRTNNLVRLSWKDESTRTTCQSRCCYCRYWHLACCSWELCHANRRSPIGSRTRQAPSADVRSRARETGDD